MSSKGTVDAAMTVTGRYLRRLRLQLTALFAVATMAALAVLSVVVFRIDSELRLSRMTETLIDRARQGAQAVTVVDGEVSAERFLADDTLTDSWPQIWVYESTDEGLLPLAGPTEDWYGVDFTDAATAAADEGDTSVRWVAPVGENGSLYGRALLVLDPTDDELAAVALAVVDADDFYGDQSVLRSQVIAAAILLAAAAAAAGYWLAGRGTRATGAALAQQERLIAAAAHELRTPVAKIRAVAESGLAGDEPAEVALARVDRMSRDAGVMVDDLLALARMDAGREGVAREPLRLDLLAEAITAQYPGVGFDAVETVVSGDPGLLRRAIENLIRNATIHGGDDVVVSVHPSRVVVGDRGPGIDPSVADRMFDRFETGASSPGHGLGLPIVRWVADSHNATITVRNRDGGGVEAVLDLGHFTVPSSTPP